jgi:hypothetical protein
MEKALTQLVYASQILIFIEDNGRKWVESPQMNFFYKVNLEIGHSGGIHRVDASRKSTAEPIFWRIFCFYQAFQVILAVSRVT